MLKEIDERRSIRQYESREVPENLIREILESAVLAPSAKNRQPWKFLVFRGKAKAELVRVMREGVADEKVTHRQMPDWTGGLADAENTVQVCEEAPCLIAVLNTNQKTPFAAISGGQRIAEICDSLSIGAAVENMLLAAAEHGLGTLWIANTCFAYDRLTAFLKTDDQLTGIIALGWPAEAPAKRPRKPMSEVVEFYDQIF